MDYVVCGSCQREFPLGSLPKFVQHKKFDCDSEDDTATGGRVLICQSCPSTFVTPWSLLQHAQTSHAMRLFIQQGPFNAKLNTITHISEGRQQGHTAKSTNTEKSGNTLQVISGPVPPLTDSLAGPVLPTGGNSVIPALALRSTLPQHQQPLSQSPAELGLQAASSYMRSRRQHGGLTNLDLNLPPECRTIDKNGYISEKESVNIDAPEIKFDAGDREVADVGVQVGKDAEAAGDEDAKFCGCSSQDCGVTIVPGTHENMKKCCTEVVPKKRKRHMETKHIPPGLLHRRKKKINRASAQRTLPITNSGSIYIDVSTSGNAPDITTQYSTVPDESRQCPGGGQRAVIIPPGSTFSIPMSYASSSAFISSVTSKAGTFLYPATMQQSTAAGTAVVGHLNVGSEVGHSPDIRAVPVNCDTESLAAASTPSAAAVMEESIPPDLEHSIMPDSALSVPLSSSIDMHGPVTNDAMYPQQAECFPKDFLEGAPDEDDGEDGELRGRRRRYPTSRPFKCDKCDRGFNQRIHLRKHQSKHTGIKPYKCEQCDYSTVERSHLKVHIRVHTGEKPYKCAYCEYATAQNSTLKIHLKRRHRDNGGFTCQHCGQEFVQKDHLDTHTQEHEGDTGKKE